MTVYRITDNLNDFQTICTTPDEIAIQLGDFDYFVRILSQATENQSLKDIWKPVELEFEDVFANNSVLPDISLWLRTYLVKHLEFYIVTYPKAESFYPLTTKANNGIYIRR